MYDLVGSDRETLRLARASLARQLWDARKRAREAARLAGNGPDFARWADDARHDLTTLRVLGETLRWACRFL